MNNNQYDTNSIQLQIEYQQAQQVFNPNWQKAQKHGLASRVRFEAGDKIQQRCQCCFQQINKTQIPLSQNTKQLQFLGFGFPLYYAFVRNCIFLLIVTLCSYNILSLYKAINISEFGVKESCESNRSDSNQLFKDHTVNHIRFFNQTNQNYQLRHFQTKKQGNKYYCKSWMVSFARIQQKVQFGQLLLRVVSLTIHLLLLVYLRDKLLKLKQYFDQRMTSLSDYSLFIKTLPYIQKPRNTIAKKMAKQYGITSLAQIILVPDLTQYEQLQQTKSQLIQKLRNKVKYQQFDQQQQEINKQIYLHNLKIHKHMINKKIQYINDKLQAQSAILIFNTQLEKYTVLEKYEQQKLQGEDWSNTKIQQAPQPKQIIWENIYLKTQRQRKLFVFGWFLSFLVLVFITVIFAFASKYKSQLVVEQMEKYQQNPIQNSFYFQEALLLVFGMIFLIVLLNKLVISNLFHKFTDQERHSDTHKFQFSFCLKYSLGLFFTTALMTLLIQAYLMNNYYKHDYGVVQQQTIMFIINSIFVPILWAINPHYLSHLFRKWRSFGKNYFTQQQANKIMQPPSYDIGKRYGQVIQIMWFTYLYLTLIPIGGIFSTFGLGLYYWIDKYNLLRKSSIQSSVSGNLITLTLNMLDFTLILRVLGEIIFDYQIRDGVHIISWIQLVCVILYQILPMQKIIECFNKQKFKLQEMPYKQAQSKFLRNYYDYHALFSVLKQDRNQLLQRLNSKHKLNRINSNIGNKISKLTKKFSLIST